MLYAALTLIIVLGLAATPITYYLRNKRNPVRPPPGATAESFKEWKD